MQMNARYGAEMAERRMETEKQKGIRRFIGWPASAVLLAFYSVSEWLCWRIGGDSGAFMFVTLHFVMMPLLSVALVVMIVVQTLRAKSWSRKLSLLSSVFVPALIVLIAVRGDPGLVRLFGPMRP